MIFHSRLSHNIFVSSLSQRIVVSLNVSLIKSKWSFWFFRSNRFKAGLKRTWEAQLVGIFTYPKWDSLVPNTVIYRRHCHNEPSAFVKLRKMNFFFFFINLVKITFSRLDEYKNIAIVSFLEKKKCTFTASTKDSKCNIQFNEW